MKRCYFTLLLLVQFELYMMSAILAKPLGAPGILSRRDLLSGSYYFKTCPAAEEIIFRKMKAWFRKDYTLAASIIRLHFHDCAVRGCDASILLNYQNSERRAYASRTLRGFQVIDDIKAKLERYCPKTVSCADILTAAARDATSLLGGPFWEAPLGRRDGKTSVAKEADLVPQGRENATSLIKFFQERGLNVLDLHRLANYKGSGGPDPSLDRLYWRNLTQSCKKSSNFKKGLLSTDQELYSDPRTAPFVSTFADQPPDLFYRQFAVSMVKLANVKVPTPPNESEIRLNCNYVNPAPRKNVNPPRHG
ncbi:class III peroxidase [Salix suchowensis]|nr:class III peroxidase [Salix suchowensis]